MNSIYSSFLEEVAVKLEQNYFTIEHLYSLQQANPKSAIFLQMGKYMLFAGQDNLGRSLLDMAIEYQNQPLMEYMLENVADPAQEDGV